MAFAEKVALRSRGGFCYELNGAFASLLGELGFEVELLEARRPLAARAGRAASVTSACGVRIDGSEWLADVGFGRGCFDEPIHARARGRAARHARATFVLRPAPDGSLDLLCDGVEQYRVTPRRTGARRLRAGLQVPPELPRFAVHARHRLHDPHTRRPRDARRHAPGRDRRQRASRSGSSIAPPSPQSSPVVSESASTMPPSPASRRSAPARSRPRSDGGPRRSATLPQRSGSGPRHCATSRARPRALRQVATSALNRVVDGRDGSARRDRRRGRP